MKNSRNYTEHEVLNSLKKKHDVRFHGKTIAILYGSSCKGDIGIKSKGKIDFLKKYCGYMSFFTTKFD